MTFDFKGARWYKCDLHLHTPASQCFEDKTVTAKQWVEKAIEQNLDCVAVTDHNTGAWIDSIKAAAAGTLLTVFPGVELTCDTSKVHLLILFNTDKTTEFVNDFIIKCGIDRSMLANKQAGTTFTIFQIAEKANAEGAVVIPAHIDGYSGLESISIENLKTFFELPYINSVQVVHKQFTDKFLQTNRNEELKKNINDYYNTPSPPIDFSTLADWHKSVKQAIEKNMAITTFSDNPTNLKSSKHGLDGIGNHYTWIKMGEKPSLEGLRQSFLLPEFRIKNEFEIQNSPYKPPELWIRSITISDTILTEEKNNFTIHFNPQLNTIIGGRGSGKSSILRFIRGVFNRTSDLNALEDILKDHNDFYKRESGKPKKGVLTENSIIKIEFVRHTVLNRITASKIFDSKRQEIEIARFNYETSTWENISDEGYIDFFEYEHYSQKQIYEIAQEPNALIERIDKAIDGLDLLKNRRAQTKKEFFQKSASIRTAEQFISSKGKIETTIKDLDIKIEKVRQSGIAELLTTKETFATQEKILNDFAAEIDEKEKILIELSETFKISDIDYATFINVHQNELKPISATVVSGIEKIKSEIEKLKNISKKLKDDYTDFILNSKWKKDYHNSENNFEIKKCELSNEGINDITNFEKLTADKTSLEIQLKDITTKTISIAAEKKERVKLQNDFLNDSKKISEMRKEFVDNILKNGKVKININTFRNKNSFEVQLRKILQKDDSFQSEIDKLTLLCFTGKVEHKIQEVRDIFLKVRKGEEVPKTMQVNFIKLINSLNDAQIDEIELFLPEDEIDVQYKTTTNSAFKSLSTASAGQKTTAILTFILSYGKVPLILDQPEDDLDNRLVYELIVDRLRQAKENRQLIIVTHNANIPVNGDAEYIVSMDTDSKTLKILNTGTVEEVSIKKEICDVMEGGEIAFDMRSKRYSQIV